ncbi:hypothetical protein PRIPAC_95177 [Pristionchus pacificus]|uniref:Uncharacterized protein n=1 Tax=Pristionchus pacificus TaxID=54126 RepID=A0A2A6BJN2_PRIPA|nr:hypothetical protein PRIPAC_95177 [Pristionchus pacificus]|eukprot:PDM66097.1 hypothetical protein PRIPAC_45322 [Pristionchus pacificus]
MLTIALLFSLFSIVHTEMRSSENAFVFVNTTDTSVSRYETLDDCHSLCNSTCAMSNGSFFFCPDHQESAENEAKNRPKLKQESVLRDLFKFTVGGICITVIIASIIIIMCRPQTNGEGRTDEPLHDDDTAV